MKFKDSKGGEWDIQLNVGTILAVKKGEVQDNAGNNLRVNLFNICSPSAFENGENARPLALRLRTDPELMIGVVWLMIQDQAKLLQVSQEDFMSRLDGSTIIALGDAFWQEVTAFYVALGRKEPVDFLAKVEDVVAAQWELIGKTIAEVEPPAS